MMRKCLILFAVVSILNFCVAAQHASLQTTPLPCTTAKQDPSQPWVYNSEALSSFPKDNPLPRFVGTFQDKNQNYRLDLYEDKKGVFGELSSPVLEADSPTSRLYNAAFDSSSGALKFSAKFWGGQLQFSGVLWGNKVEATVTQNARAKKVTLKRVKSLFEEEVSYTSRAQFDCAMILYRRY